MVILAVVGSLVVVAVLGYGVYSLLNHVKVKPIVEIEPKEEK